MAERVQALNGSFNVRRGHGEDQTRGTTLTVELPLAA